MKKEEHYMKISNHASKESTREVIKLRKTTCDFNPKCVT